MALFIIWILYNFLLMIIISQLQNIRESSGTIVRKKLVLSTNDGLNIDGDFGDSQ